MKLLLDMNLSPRLVEVFARLGLDAVHWSNVGDPGATDKTIMAFARDGGFVVVTHDLDFGTLLAATGANGPSVIQIRAGRLSPDDIGPILVAGIKRTEEQLKRGALVIIQADRVRLRLLPLPPP